MSGIGDAINRYYERREREKVPRGHLGASVIGKTCEQELNYEFRWAHTNRFSGRLLRLFERGHREEPWIFEDLRAIGVEIFDVDQYGKQFGIPPLAKGHLRGSLDAVAIGLPTAPDPAEAVLLDIKTSTEKKFARIEKVGFEMECPTYYAQGQMYMGGFNLKRACYLFIAKDSDRMMECWFEFNPDFYAHLIKKAERIVNANGDLTRAGDSIDDFTCRWCDFKELCHTNQQSATVTCRSCIHSTPIEGGSWYCDAWQRECSVTEQWAACDSHIFLPHLLPYGKAIKSGGEPAQHNCWIEYQMPDGGTFKNVVRDAGGAKIAGEYSSRELTAGPQFIGDEGVDLIRTQFDGEVVSTDG